ncbi:hypothetical protein ACFOU0_01180 [Salinicoccus sesuvii]|uniref:DUF3899 domain-containing protein n=1 Tax=Salinicoccus sesuvii TaxID=868281 RepID=A0ABV7N0W1_9STAP
MPTFTFAVAYFAAIKIERIKSTYALETYEKVVAFSEGQPIEKLTSQKTWKDTMSVVGVPATFLIVLLFSFYVFSLV